MVKRGLTYDDPEPPVGSVVLDETGIAWQTDGALWRSTSSDFLYWSDMECLGTLTLVYRGPDPEPPTTWTPGDPLPPEGTVIALPGECSLTHVGGNEWVAGTNVVVSGPTPVLRWGWNK